MKSWFLESISYRPAMQQEPIEVIEGVEPQKNSKRDWLGSMVGLTIVVGGMAILYSVFREALHLFTTPPSVWQAKLFRDLTHDASSSGIGL